MDDNAPRDEMGVPVGGKYDACCVTGENPYFAHEWEQRTVPRLSAAARPVVRMNLVKQALKDVCPARRDLHLRECRCFSSDSQREPDCLLARDVHRDDDSAGSGTLGQGSEFLPSWRRRPPEGYVASSFCTD